MFSTATKIQKTNFRIFSGRNQQQTAVYESIILNQQQIFISGQRNYAGHSHWHNIKFKKERSDLIKMQAYCKLAASIRNAVRVGGANPIENPLLAGYLETAKKTAFSKEKVTLAIKVCLIILF